MNSNRHYLLLAGLLLLFALRADHSIKNKWVTIDEYIHLASGCYALSTGDSRVVPEAGLLSTLWPALGVKLAGFPLPSITEQVRPLWKQGNKLALSAAYMDPFGLELLSVLRCARRMVIIEGLLLALLTYYWSRKIFGLSGGLVSLAVFTLSPNFLAHTRLTNTDIMSTLFIWLAIASIWLVIKEVSWWTVPLCGLTIGLALLTKFSSLLLAPIAAIFVLLRLWNPRPIFVNFGKRQEVTGWNLCLVILFSALAALLIAMAVVWAFHGFNFSPSGGISPHLKWRFSLTDLGSAKKWVLLLRDYQLMPETWVYGLANTLKTTQMRGAFMKGEYRGGGWWYFFPFAFLVKTPHGTQLIFLLTLVCFVYWVKRGYRQYERVDPNQWWIPVAISTTVFLVTALTAGINIGYRHAFPTLFGLMILLGQCSTCLEGSKRLAKGALFFALAMLFIESLLIHPHYLAFFNELSGGPEGGYKLLVDSNVDWGQDVELLRQWIVAKKQSGDKSNFFAALFGPETGQPYFEVPQTTLLEPIKLSKAGRPKAIGPGIYCISAHILQGMTFRFGFYGAWDKRKEENYRKLKSQMELQTKEDVHLTRRFEIARIAKLCSGLKNKEPDGHVGYSILIFDLDEKELQELL